MTLFTRVSLRFTNESKVLCLLVFTVQISKQSVYPPIRSLLTAVEGLHNTEVKEAEVEVKKHVGQHVFTQKLVSMLMFQETPDTSVEMFCIGKSRCPQHWTCTGHALECTQDRPDTVEPRTHDTLNQHHAGDIVEGA